MRVTAAAVAVIGVLSVPTGPQSIHTLAQRDPSSRFLDRSSAAVSADGRFVAFTSYARLAPADTDSQRDIYVLDRADGEVTLEQNASDASTTHVDSGHPGISGDGRFLVYARLLRSAAEPLRSEIVLRDRREATVTIVSVGPGGVRADGMSSHPAISQDGRVVVFSSVATNLVAGRDTNDTGSDIYLFDTRDRRLSRISVDSEGVQPVSGSSMTPATSGDGRYVAFASTADLDGRSSKASPSDPRLPPAVFVRDRIRNLTTRVGVTAGGRPPDDASWAPAISADGRYVAFVSTARNISAADRNRSADVFLADLQSGSLELLSRSAVNGAAANGPSSNPVLSADGRFVAFQSEASDLLCARCTKVSEDVNLLLDVYLFDRQRGTMTRVSGDATGGWMEPSAGPAVDGAGELVVFSSRHPIDASDAGNDWDLFLCAAPSGSRGLGLLRERAHRLDHRHQPHALPHRDVLAEDALDDAAVDAGDFGWRRSG
jgi:Tol biopolymer transport system component